MKYGILAFFANSNYKFYKRCLWKKFYSAQIQKYKVENIVERLIENKDKADIKFKNTSNLTKTVFQDMKYPFIEYMSYTLKRYGKKGVSYLKALEETVEIFGK